MDSDSTHVGTHQSPICLELILLITALSSQSYSHGSLLIHVAPSPSLSYFSLRDTRLVLRLSHVNREQMVCAKGASCNTIIPGAQGSPCYLRVLDGKLRFHYSVLKQHDSQLTRDDQMLSNRTIVAFPHHRRSKTSKIADLIPYCIGLSGIAFCACQVKPLRHA